MLANSVPASWTVPLEKKNKEGRKGRRKGSREERRKEGKKEGNEK